MWVPTFPKCKTCGEKHHAFDGQGDPECKRCLQEKMAPIHKRCVRPKSTTVQLPLIPKETR